MRTVLNNIGMFGTITFIISSLFINFYWTAIFILMSIIIAVIFKKNRSNMIKIKNQQIYICLMIVEVLIALISFMISNANVSLMYNAFYNLCNTILFMFANLLMFVKIKKSSDHCITLYVLVMNLLCYIFLFNSNNSNLLSIYIFLVPFISYLCTKVDKTSPYRKKNLLIYSIVVVLLLFVPVSLIIFKINDLFNFSLRNFLLILMSLFYFNYINSIAHVMNGRVNIFKKFQIKKFLKPDKHTIRKVTAVIPNYNYAKYIGKRIDSIINQTYPIYELIILDDCSKDNSIEVIEKEIEILKKKRPNLKIKFVKNEKNSGNVFKQWKKAFDLFTGDYLWICEADDLCSKYFLNSVMQGFNDDQVVLSYSESKAIDEYGKVFKDNLRDWIDIYKTGHWNNDYIEDGKHELRYFMSINNTIANVSGVVFKRIKNFKYEEYLKESQNYTLAGDWYFYSKILLNGKISYVSNSFNYHRIHSSSVTSTTDNFVHYKEILKIQNSINNDVKLSAPMLERVKDRNNNLRKNLCISDDELYYDDLSLTKLLKSKKINDEIILSIIIPVYNVEKYIKKCLASVFRNLPVKTEVIIINDGSPDNSEEIINEFCKKHKEIVYIKKKNGGLSSVKNLGLKKARGKYVIFLDSDDYVSSNMYNTMLKKIIDTDSDLVYCDVLMTYEDGSVKYVTMKNFQRSDSLMQILDGNLMAASWNKIVRRELYDGLEFPEGLNNEDIAVSPQLFLRAKKMEYISSPFYKYVQRAGSIQNSGFSEKRLVIFKTAKICFDSIRDYDYISQEKIIGSIVTHQLLAILIYMIIPIENIEEREKFIMLFCKEFNDLDIDISFNPYVYEYLSMHNSIQLLDYIRNCDYQKIVEIGKEM